MKIGVSYYTAKGSRKNNEDSVSIQEGRGVLAIVADGLGGHDNGEVASQLAVATMNGLLKEQSPEEDRLIDAIEQANAAIYRQQQRDGKIMRTTVAALWLEGGRAVVANVGDSRIYQFRGDKIIYQSLDHSVAQMAVLVGELDASEIRHNKDRNKLIRALGTEETPKADSELLSVQPGDRFLLCSDGFWEEVTEECMLATIAGQETVDGWLNAMRRVVETARNPLQDNHTAIVLIIQ